MWLALQPYCRAVCLTLHEVVCRSLRIAQPRTVAGCRGTSSGGCWRRPLAATEVLQFAQQIEPAGQCRGAAQAVSDRKERGMSELVPRNGYLTRREGRRVSRSLTRLDADGQMRLA